MKLLFIITSLLVLTACEAVTVGSKSGICAGLRPLVDAHADGLLVDAGPLSIVTGQRLIAGVDAGCG